MKKKLLSFVLLSSLTLSACIPVPTRPENDDSIVQQTPEYETHTSVDSVPNVENENDNDDVTLEDLQITEYSYENTIGDTLHFLVIKNNSDKTLQIESNSTAHDASGTIIGADSSELEALGPDCESVLIDYFDRVSGVDHFEYSLFIQEDPYYDSVIQDLDAQYSLLEDKVIITCTNTGEEAARFVNATVLFFYEGTLISYDSTYIMDSEDELKPGATLSEQLDCYKKFDDIKVYFGGRR